MTASIRSYLNENCRYGPPEIPGPARDIRELVNKLINVLGCAGKIESLPSLMEIY